MPERHLPGLAGGGADHDLVLRDLLDPPGRRAQHEDLALPGLEHHLLVELAHAPLLPASNAAAFGLRPARGGAPGLPGREKHAVQAAVGNGPRVRDRYSRRSFPRAQRPRDPVPGHARAELGELVRRIPPGEHVQDTLERGARKIGEGSRPPDHRVDVVHLVHAVRGVRDDLLRQHVERIARVERLFHLAGGHAPGRRRAAEQVAPVLGEDHPLGDAADLMASPADPLQPGRDRRRGLDLHHQVHRSHVDPQLERGGRHDRRQVAALEPVLHLLALVARHRAVVGERHLGARQLVERARQPLREPPGVDEDHRRPVLADQIQQPGMDGRPDAPPLRPCGSRIGRQLLQLAERGEVVDGHLDPDLELLLGAGVHDGHRPRLPLLSARLAAAQQARHLVEGALGGGEPDALHGGPGQLLEALEREE